VIEAIVLDSSPLGRLVHPRLNVEISDWLDGALAAGVTVYIPEIIDYEVRRALLFGGLTRSIQRLDEFKTSAVLSAAQQRGDARCS